MFILGSSFRKILLPLSFLYGVITNIRNKAFDQGYLSSSSFDFPVITVGNLSVGGTGKTPMIEYLIGLLQKSRTIAVLSRGYGRKTKGFLLAEPGISAIEIGDEPFQFFRKFRNLHVAVDENRVRGIKSLRKLKPDIDLVLLDDAFQHRYVQGGLKLLLTTYENLYIDDFIVPTGSLREGRKGADRADLIIVSKCPATLSEQERLDIIERIAPKKHQEVFFSSIEYDDHVYNEENTIPLTSLSDYRVLLVTGIANPEPLKSFLNDHKLNYQHLKFADHEFIDQKGQKKIELALDALESEKKLILTTEKDYVRSFLQVSLPVYYLPIKTVIMKEEHKFNEIIQNYVRKN